QPEGLELVLGDLALEPALDLVAKLRHARLDEGMVELVVAVERAHFIRQPRARRPAHRRWSGRRRGSPRAAWPGEGRVPTGRCRSDRDRRRFAETGPSGRLRAPRWRRPR